MSWIRLNYFPNPIKRHIVHESVIDIVRRDTKSRHGFLPESEEDDVTLLIDPGGMIMMNTEPKKFDFDGSPVAIKPEHILGGIYRWTRHRVLDEKTSDGEEIIKVYLDHFEVAVMPRSIYDDIGAWLALSKAEGYVARMDIVEALSGNPNIIVAKPPVEGEC